MNIGILETGKVAPELVERHGDYPAMFRRLLGAADATLTFTVHDITAARIPQRVDQCDAWLITGSRHGVYDDLPWIAPLEQFLQAAYAADVPIVGICFGHQILAEALGGKVIKSERGWGLGVRRYKVYRQCDWMSGIDDTFALPALHQDQIIELPADAAVLAGSEFCPYAVLGYRGNAMSIQAHPEFRTDYLRDLIAQRRGTLISEADAEHGLASLETPTHRTEVANWIVTFLRRQSARQRAAG